ncbi:Rieske 2Fe-2S domain-containing protein [Accumulibacter sp.]|uniref:Rieske (2Fe-2S) protein n=1 Tax=Accumulibacter sp. TaxID=2053492 RepID=UPI002629545E|nr:Rieske 2Fe-2S domain-containing protein [Accumulibacter sp.]
MAAHVRLICRAADLVDGGPGVRFAVQRSGLEEVAFAVRFRGRVAAYLNRCAHVPIELDWQPGEFFDDSGVYLICATHGALYSPEDGRCLGGRCNGRGLTPLPVEERDGEVYFIPGEQIS